MTQDDSRIASLLDRIDAGERIKWLFFWGHTASGLDVGKACLSQWFPSAFEVSGIRYMTAEHWMMAEKARLFGDEDALAKILEAEHPGEAKALGRKVQNFDEATWARERYEIVVRGSIAKFSAHDRLRAFLLGTSNRVLVEASPRDQIWGIGLGASNPRAENPGAWRGLNLLGFALMDAREHLSTS
ncbi:MAG: NADAR family protein [Bacteroidota bacterium]